MELVISHLLKHPISILGGIILVLFSQVVYGTDPSPSDSPYFIHGYDLVSYHHEEGPVKGATTFSVKYKSHTLLFSSEETRDEFLGSPEYYMPAYNGYCAYGMVFGMKSKIDPLEFDIVDGKLFLQLDSGTRRRWNRKMNRNIKKGNRAWRKLAVTSDGS